MSYHRFIELPLEIIEHILTFTDPLSLSRISQTCSMVHALVYGYDVKSKGKGKAFDNRSRIPEEDRSLDAQSQLIWRELFLSELLDDPRVCQNPLGEKLFPSSSDPANDNPQDGFTSKLYPLIKFDWRNELQRRYVALSFVQHTSQWPSATPSHLLQVLDTLVHIAMNTPPLSPSVETIQEEISRNLLSLARIPLAEFLEYFEEKEEYRYSFEPGPNYDYDGGAANLDEEVASNRKVIRQRLAQLHTLSGLTLSDFTRQRRFRTRGFVYDMSNYCEHTSWGPFISKTLTLNSQTERDKELDTLGVNWEHILAVQHVMAMHVIAPSFSSDIPLDEDENEEPLDIYAALGIHEDDRYNVAYRERMNTRQNIVTQPQSHQNPQLSRRLSMLPYCQTQRTTQANTLDWAGVAGSYTCSFCFVDHRELLAYNSSHLRLSQLPPPPPSAPRKGATFNFSTEVFRSFPVYLKFVGTELNPGGRLPKRPRILFEGRLGVRGRRASIDEDTEEDGGGQIMSGWVGIEGEPGEEFIHWSFTSGDNGEMIWASEGVQVGPVQSTFGVLGTWTTVFHDEGDPVGPFWLRKVLDTE